MVPTSLKKSKLKKLISSRLEELQLPAEPSSLYDPVRYTLSLGGKRIRPYFTLLACGLCAGDPRDALPAGMAIELLHNFTLLHDDIMDDAETRRGKKSVYKKWNSSTAILSGDAMYAWAFEQLQHYGKESSYTKEQYAKIMSIFLKSARTVCEGQAYDLEFENRKDVRLDDYLKMIKGKTAALISAAFQLGGAVAGADEEQIQSLQEIGNEAGIAFQIQDDLLDAVADPTKFGKKQGGDILEGKKTYLSILALEQGTVKQKEYVQSILKSYPVDQSEIHKVIGLYEELGIIAKTEGIIEKHYNNAIELINNFETSEYQETLKAYLSNLINREY